MISDAIFVVSCAVVCDTTQACNATGKVGGWVYGKSGWFVERVDFVRAYGSDFKIAYHSEYALVCCLRLATCAMCS